MQKGKSTDGLMRHIRDKHHIDIRNSNQKKALLQMGYYHGYKAYRFHRTIDNLFELTNFDQVSAICKYDEKMKSLFYPIVIKFETLMKNYLIEQSVKDSPTSYEYVYESRLTNYRSFNPKTNPQEYHRAVNTRLRLKKTLDSTVASNFDRGEHFISHYIESNKPIPLWAIFEGVTLGTVGDFASALNSDDRIQIAESLNIYDKGFDPYAKIVYQEIYVFRPLRNSIAHNKPIFDCRFQNSRISKNLKQTIKNKVGLSTKVDFETLFDYFAMGIVFLKETGSTITELKQLLREFDAVIGDLYAATKQKKKESDTKEQEVSAPVIVPLPLPVYNLIVGSKIKLKIDELSSYISSN